MTNYYHKKKTKERFEKNYVRNIKIFLKKKKTKGAKMPETDIKKASVSLST